MTDKTDESPHSQNLCSLKDIQAKIGECGDEEIARRVQEGDIESFGLLVGRYEAKITRYAGKFLLNGEDDKDLAQEVFIKAYVNIQSFDANRKFSSWLYRIAHNEFINAIRKRSWSRFSIFGRPIR